MRRVFLVLVILTAIGCGDDDGSGTDAGAVDGSPVPDGGVPLGMPAPPAPPAAPAEAMLPNLLPCPPGWREVVDGELTICDPWPETGVADCMAIDEAHFPGESDCRRVGELADVDGWPTGIPATARVLYVRAGAVGGDGSRAAPYPDVRAAVGRARSGDVVAVAAGTYDGRVRVPAGVTVWGASVADVEITVSGPFDISQAAVSAIGMGVVVRNLRITGNMNGVDAVGGTRSITLEDVVVDSTEGVGIYLAMGASATIRDSVLRDIRSLTKARLGRGLSVEMGAQATVEGSVFLRCRAEAMTSSITGSRLEVRDTAAIDTQSRLSDLQRGYGVFALEAEVVAERVAVIGSREAAVRSANAGGVLTATDLAIRDTSGRALDGLGSGVFVDNGGTASLTRSSVVDSGPTTVFVDVSTLDMTDTIVRGVRALPAGRAMGGGRAVFYQDRSTGTLVRTAIADVDNFGFTFGLADVTVEDATAFDIHASENEPTRGSAFVVVMGSNVTLDRGRFERAAFAGLGGQAGGSLLASDVIVRDVGMAPGDLEGAGVAAQEGIRIELTRALVERVGGVGLNSVSEGTVLLATDVTVRDVVPRARDGLLGIGATTAMGGEIEIQRGLIERIRGVGFGADRSTIRLVDTEVRGVELRDPSAILGTGIHVQLGSTIEAQRLVVAEATGAGFYVRDNSTVTLTDVHVRDTRSTTWLDIEGILGQGIMALSGPTVSVRNGRFTANREGGIVANGAGATINLEGVVIEGTLQRECVDTGACMAGAGTGLAAFEGGRVTATDFVVADSALAGVQVARGGEMDLSAGEVRGNAVGANVQIEGYDIARIMGGVRYRDNGVNLDATVLPVPEAPDVMTSM